MKNYIVIKNEIIQRYFSRNFFKGILTIFGDWANTCLAKHLLIRASVRSWFFNVSTAMFWKEQNIPKVKRIQMLDTV